MNFISNQNEPGSFLLNNNEKLAEKLAQEVIQKEISILQCKHLSLKSSVAKHI
ncbi:MAG: hypothetical protein HWD61_06360 [Parachlamydiaceae bacterium]|nr:MAG: hypothetical protein HWD61_06360 [Parachlamydiaceae bacterium]